MEIMSRPLAHMCRRAEMQCLIPVTQMSHMCLVPKKGCVQETHLYTDILKK